MRCMACGAEMRLTQVVRDNTMSGYERHSLHCACCGETERHLVFRRESVLREPVPMQHVRSSLMPPAAGVWARAIARLRDWQVG